MCERFSCERSKAKKFREDAEKEKQEWIQGQWQQESPATEQVKSAAKIRIALQDDETGLLCVERRRLGRVQKHLQSPSKSHGMGL